jgi:hypothetical protein
VVQLFGSGDWAGQRLVVRDRRLLYLTDAVRLRVAQQLDHNSSHVSAMPQGVTLNPHQGNLTRHFGKQPFRFGFIRHIDVAWFGKDTLYQLTSHQPQHKAGMCQTFDFVVLGAFDDAPEQLALNLVLANTGHHQVRHAFGALALAGPDFERQIEAERIATNLVCDPACELGWLDTALGQVRSRGSRIEIAEFDRVDREANTC